MSQTAQSPTALPLYVQVSELLVREILAGRLIDGERLPPEREMAKDLGVAIGTLRKALADLSEKGLLQRVQGSGNYVKAGGSVETVYAMFRLELLKGGGLPRADLLDVQTLKKPGDLPDFGGADTAARIRRIRYLNDLVIALEEIWLDSDQGVVRPAALSDSLYRYYRTHLGFWITRAEDRVRIGPVPNWAPSAFPRNPGDTVGFVERFSWADKPRPVEFSRTWFDPDRAHYVQRLK